jgi:hypothetical protein
MDVPLPDQPAVPLKVEFLPEVGIGFLSGQGQQMIILPMVPGLVDNWATALPQADKEKYDKPGAGCGWKALRSFIATTDYVLGGVFNGKPPANLKGKASELRTCQENPIYDLILAGRVLTEEEREQSKKIFDLTLEQAGVPDELTGINCYEIKKGGDMSMTIVARFESPTSGFGHVYFEGRTDRSNFAGNAPITLSR